MSTLIVPHVENVAIHSYVAVFNGWTDVITSIVFCR